MSQLENLLSMIGPENAIILNEEIGLLGNTVVKGKYTGGIVKIPSNWSGSIYSRGETFKLIDNDGCIVIDADVYKVGIIIDEDSTASNEENTASYVFMLKGIRAISCINMFFASENDLYAIIVYHKGDWYVNNIQGLDISMFNLDANLALYERDVNHYLLTFNKAVYASINNITDNGIHIFNKVRDFKNNNKVRK